MKNDETCSSCEKCGEIFSISHEYACNLKEENSFVHNFRHAVCSICLNKYMQCTLNELELTKCGHVFHKQCMDRNIKYGQNKCPNCNFFINERDLKMQVYLS